MQVQRSSKTPWEDVCFNVLSVSFIKIPKIQSLGEKFDIEKSMALLRAPPAAKVVNWRYRLCAPAIELLRKHTLIYIIMSNHNALA